MAGERAPDGYSGTISQQVSGNALEIGSRVLHLAGTFGLGSGKTNKAFVDEITKVLPLGVASQETQQPGCVSSIDFSEGRVPRFTIGDTVPLEALDVLNHKIPLLPSRGVRAGHAQPEIEEVDR